MIIEIIHRKITNKFRNSRGVGLIYVWRKKSFPAKRSEINFAARK